MRSHAAPCLLALGALLTASTGCRRPQAVLQEIASYDGGAISAADLDRAILDMPGHQRQPADGDLLAWYERIAKELAVHQILLAEARAAGAERDPAFAAVRAEAAKQAVVADFIANELPPPEPPSERDTEAFYELHRSEFRSEAVRQTWHLFRRVGPGAEPRAVVAEVEALRRRVLAGESFRELAAEHSDSESRHRQGLLGWVRRGHFNPELDRLVFALPLHEPSAPLRTREGVHLFLVTAERPQKTYGYADVRLAIAQRLAGERLDAAIVERVGNPPAGSLVPDAAGWEALVEAGDPQAVVLQIGELRLTLAEMEQRLLALQGALELPDASAPEVLLQALTQRELIYRYCREHSLDRSPRVGAQLQRVLDRGLSGLRLRQRLLERANREPERLEEYYLANRPRFSTPLKLRIERLHVPLSASGNEAMARLEQVRGDLDRGRLTFAVLAEELHGSVEESGWQTLGELAERGARAAALVAALPAGRHAPPYRDGSRIEMIGVRERQEPRALPFEEVRDRVAADFVFNHRVEAYAELEKEVLDDARFQVSRERLEDLLRNPPGTLPPRH